MSSSNRYVGFAEEQERKEREKREAERVAEAEKYSAEKLQEQNKNQNERSQTNNYYINQDARDDRIKRAEEAIFQEDDLALERVRLEQRDRGLRDYEAQAEMERADYLARQRLEAQDQEQNKQPGQEQDSREARLQAHLNKRDAQRSHEQEQTQNKDLDIDDSR